MKPKQSLRFAVLGGFFTVMAILIIARMVRIQVGPEREAFKEQGEVYTGELVELVPYRGKIYDRWGNLLAGNESVYEVGLNMGEVYDPNSIALAASVVLGRDYGTVLSELESAKENGLALYVLDNFGSQDEYDQLQAFIEQEKETLKQIKDPEPKDQSLQAIEFKARQQRVYPEKNLASNVLGYLNWERRSAFGVEGYFDDLLAGVEKEYWEPIDPNRAAELRKPTEGANLILTIDREIQSAMETILDAAIKANGAQAGTIVIMHPETGEILAMASAPRMNLNKFWKAGEVFGENQSFNLAIHSYEPGSVFKVITMASALDSGTVEPDTTFIDTGVIQVGGVPIYNWNGGAWGPQTMLGCMQHSLNVCLAWLSTEMGAAGFYEYLQAFGFGHKTGIELDMEATGHLKLPGDSDWYEIDLATNSFGQGISVTPVQMLMAISAIANDGQMVAPRIVKGVVDRNRQYSTSVQVTGKPIKAETAHALTQMLAVSLEEEASDAVVPGYRVAGKTGTAEIPIPGVGYSMELTNASFVGWGPVDDAQFIVYVWFEKPTSSIWGSVVAAPVFREVVQRLVVLMNLPPDSVRQSMAAPPP